MWNGARKHELGGCSTKWYKKDQTRAKYGKTKDQKLRNQVEKAWEKIKLKARRFSHKIN